MKTTQSSAAKFAKISLSWWLGAGLVLAIAAAYWPVAGYAFTFYDDNEYVWQNPHVLRGLSWPGVGWAFTHFYFCNWHPLTLLSYMAEAQWFGLNAGAYHVTNVVFHAANTVLLFVWLQRLTGFLWRSAVVAALFGLHPLHVESVAWISERKDVLSTFFLLLALICYTRYAKPEIANRKSKIVNYLLSLLCFALGLMCKPMVVTLPFLLLLLDYWPLKRVRGWKRLLVEKLPFFVLSAVSCVLTFFAQRGKSMADTTVLPVGDRLENALVAYAGYLKKMLWPDPLAAFYPLITPIDEDLVIGSVVLLLLLSAVIFFQRRQRPYLVTGWLWYLGMLVPVIGLVQVGSQAMADRYTYVPLIGVFIAFVWLVAEISMAWPGRRFVLAVLAAGVLAVCWQVSAVQVRYWQNSETLARHALAVTSHNPPMELVLGSALIEQGKIEEAGQHFAEVLKLLPNSVPALADLALAYYAQGRLEEAVDKCREALVVEPDEPKVYYELACLLAKQGKWSEAAAEYQALLQINPNHLFALNNLAWLRATASDARLRDGPEAVRLAEKACQLSNYQATFYMGTLAAAYAEAGRFDVAVKTAQKAVALASAGKQPALIQKNRELLALYEQQKAYHEPASH